MNIFFLSDDPYESAKMMVDRHVVKMIVESAQLMSTAHRILDGVDNHLSDERQTLLYKVTHKNHPSAIWTRTSVQNYNWLVDHFHGLLKEYTHRYEKIHKCQNMLMTIQSPPLNLKDWDWTEPPQCMPDEFKIKDSYIENYREYYRKGKSHIHTWKKRLPPNWILND